MVKVAVLVQVEDQPAEEVACVRADNMADMAVALPAALREAADLVAADLAGRARLAGR